MPTAESTRQDQGRNETAGVGQAAKELAERLKDLADELAVRRAPTPVRRRPAVRGAPVPVRRRSPAGFVLDARSKQLLLPDGRIWSYSLSDHVRFPNGRIYDVATDYGSYIRCRMSPGGREFVFLGVIIGKYSFGFVAGEAADPTKRPCGLCAIYSSGPGLVCVTADEAFAAIADALNRQGAILA